MQQLIARLEPLAFRGAQLLIAVAVAYGGWTLVKPHLSSVLGNPFNASIVTFDVVKLANAQRAVASAFIKPDAVAPDAATALMAMQKNTREVIERVAGKGTLVLVRQAVVNRDLPDITDAVLRELGLPANAPTQNATAYTLDEAPTNLSLMPTYGQKKTSDAPQPSAAGKLVP